MLFKLFWQKAFVKVKIIQRSFYYAKLVGKKQLIKDFVAGNASMIESIEKTLINYLSVSFVIKCIIVKDHC